MSMITNRRILHPGSQGVISGSVGGVGGVISSMQRGLVTIAADVTTGTATVTAVDLANTVIRLNGYIGNNVTIEEQLSRIDLTNSTTITFTRDTAGSVTSIAAFNLKEYKPGIIKSIQSGTITKSFSNFLDNLSVTSVDLNKSELIHLGSTSTDATNTNYPRAFTHIQMTSSTNIRVTVAQNNTEVVTGWMLVEYR